MDTTIEDLDAAIAALAAQYRPLAEELLRAAVRVPADHLAADSASGLSNHERPRLELWRQRIVAEGAVESPADVWFDDFGNLVWEVRDDDTPAAERRVVWLDGHSDTVQALRESWREKIGGVDAYEGLVDPAAVDEAFLQRELGYLPPRDEWSHVVFGRGSADQLGGVVCQIVATKILLELRELGALDGVVVRAHATVAEEDNDGGGPLYLVREVLPSVPAHELPDVVILTEGTGDAEKGAVGIYRGQRGRMQIEVAVTGRSCHGSMPWEGLNPLEYGAAILVEATAQAARGEGLAQHPFLGAGTRTASWAHLDTPSDCAVPDRFTFRFDRRLTAGESADEALAAIDDLPAVAVARERGLIVDVRVPTYTQPTWRGYTLGNEQIYPGWETPRDHPAVEAVVDAYRRVVTPSVRSEERAGMLRREPRVDRWIFSTDGVGFVVDERAAPAVPAGKRWVNTAGKKHPAMFGIGPGIEQNTHKIGEAVDLRELVPVIAVLARFPSLFAKRG